MMHGHAIRSAAAAALLALSATAGHAAPVTIDFDAFGSGILLPPGAAEDGFTLSGSNVVLTGFAFLYTGFSVPNFINAAGDQANWVLTLTETDGSAFSFLSADAVNSLLGSGDLLVRGFQGATLVGTDSFLVSNNSLTAQTFSASTLSGLALTRLEIEGQVRDGDPAISILADNIRLETDATIAAVPLPAAGWLLLGGLGALGLVARRRPA